MRLRADVRWWLQRGQERFRLYDRQLRANHRAIQVGHREQPQYSRKTRRLLTRLFR